jgi:hypothetical protein
LIVQFSVCGAGFPGIHSASTVGAFEYGDFGDFADLHDVFNQYNTVVYKVNKKRPGGRFVQSKNPIRMRL